MDTISDAEKVKIAGGFLLNAPPGEFNDVFNDIRVLIGNDQLLQRGVTPHFEQYNTEQFTPVDVPGQSHKVIISKFNQIDTSHYFDPRSNQSFTFDHLRQVASDPQPHSGASHPQRKAVDDAFQEYINEHFSTGIVSVYPHDGHLVVCVVANKYNPRNYWNGRWRSQWTVEISGDQAKAKGVLRSQVHYYEDGNVQLNSEKSVEVTASGGDIANKIVQAAKKAEIEYQTAINESYGQLSSTTFKALRRALPITGTKLDWNKILAYKIGGELSQK
jgi:capping protein alpha